MISYNKHYIDKSDVNEVVKVLKSDWITQGSYVNKFENSLKKKFGSKYSVAVSSGTAGLHLTGIALNWKKGDVILLSSVTFLATANCILYSGAYLDLIDIDSNNYNIDIFKLEKRIIFYKKKGINISAVIATDYAGQPCDWHKLSNLSNKYRFKLINDNCHAIGSKYKNSSKYASKYADVTIHSYHAVKNITTGEGGSILTNDINIYNKVKMLRTHGLDNKVNKNSAPWFKEMKLMGFNYRITDFQCALGYSQLKKLSKYVNIRRNLANNYNINFKKNKNVIIPHVEKFAFHSYHLYPLQINFKSLNKPKIHFYNYCKKNNINLQIHYVPLQFQKYYNQFYKFKNKDLKNSKQFYENVFSIPLYCGLNIKDQSKIIKMINYYCKHYSN